jgi:hypothetical protein
MVRMGSRWSALGPQATCIARTTTVIGRQRNPRSVTPAEDRAATQGTDRPSGRWQADSVTCSHVIA